ncbi:hypothetical protein BSKO_08532 [Bryopsis sp. KO-2023]|nr:hypothetical protein BSKO_08532 [Bryopsis sp. KO-2023]
MRQHKSRNSNTLGEHSPGYWGYKMAPQMHHGYQGGPPHGEYSHHVAYAPHLGQVEPVLMPQVVFPYHMPPGQAHVFGDNGYPRGHYQHFVPVQVPVHGGSPQDNGHLLVDDMEHLSLKAGKYVTTDEHYDEYAPKGTVRGGSYTPSPSISPKKGFYKLGNEGEAIQNTSGGRVRTRKRRSRKSKDKQQALQENIRKTVYISDIDQLVTEEQLANLFSDCGVVVDCRVCGDPNSAMRFAFVEFMTLAEAKRALEKNGSELGSARLRVLPSKTAIVPVNKELMPKTEDEMEQCSRTIYATNIDKKVDRDDVQRFFEALCGPVGRLRLLGDHAHSTRIAFVEFTEADSALAALSCSGALLGTMPIRVSPSKTPVRFSGQDAVK